MWPEDIHISGTGGKILLASRFFLGQEIYDKVAPLLKEGTLEALHEDAKRVSNKYIWSLWFPGVDEAMAKEKKDWALQVLDELNFPLSVVHGSANEDVDTGHILAIGKLPEAVEIVLRKAKEMFTLNNNGEVRPEDGEEEEGQSQLE